MHNAYCVHIVEGEGGGEQQQRARTQEEDQERGKTKKGNEEVERKKRRKRSGGSKWWWPVSFFGTFPSYFSFFFSPSLSLSLSLSFFCFDSSSCLLNLLHDQSGCTQAFCAATEMYPLVACFCLLQPLTLATVEHKTVTCK